MVHLGIIGTNWITHQFVQGALETGRYTLTAVYSRRLETAQEFASKYEGNIACETQLATFFATPLLDTVYIASPNSLHFSQAKAAILAGKHVIVEKPAFSNPREMAEIIELAKKQDVFSLKQRVIFMKKVFKRLQNFYHHLSILSEPTLLI